MKDYGLPAWWIASNGWDFWTQYHDGAWEADTHAYIDQYIRPGSTYVDVGAWVGPTVLWAAPKAKRVVAVEPDPVAFEILNNNCALDELTNVDFVNAAISAETGIAQIVSHTEGFGSSMSRLLGMGVPQSSTWDLGSARDVDCFTLPDLFTKFAIENVSLVKMDMEGGEAEVLEEACPFLAGLGITFVVSLHPTWWNHTVQREWFDCFSELRGEWDDQHPLLAIP